MRTRTAKIPSTAVTRSVAATTLRGCRTNQAATRSIATHHSAAAGPAAKKARPLGLARSGRYTIRMPGPVPRVSVLLPARNAADTLPAALRSLGRQTFRDWECVVVDDGSEDGTAAMAGAADPRVTVLATPSTGLVGALTLGLTHCRAEYVARMDADDVMRRDRLACQVAALDAAPHLAGLGGHVRVFPRHSTTAGLRRHERRT